MIRTETCIIFDWDDTLLSSSWLASNGLRLDSPDVLPAEVVSQLTVLEEAVLQLLERAAALGNVVIITNAEAGWVELSARKFMPHVVPMLSTLRVVSARSTYEAAYPDSPSDWKVAAFGAEIGATYAASASEARKNIISLGDSIHERAAIHKVTAGMGPSTFTKSIKFLERPTVEQLKRQVDLITSCLPDVAAHKEGLDLMLTIQLLY